MKKRRAALATPTGMSAWQAGEPAPRIFGRRQMPVFWQPQFTVVSGPGSSVPGWFPHMAKKRRIVQDCAFWGDHFRFAFFERAKRLVGIPTTHGDEKRRAA